MSQDQGRIVVGVDGTHEGDAALLFAIQEAERGGDIVELVTAWTVDVPAAASVATLPLAVPPSLPHPQTRAEQLQASSLVRVAGTAPTVPVAQQTVEGDAGPVLVRAARDARLLVVGSRSLGLVRAVLLGSVSRYCAQHATCPVVVVPRRAEPVNAGDAEALVPVRTETAPT